MNTAQALSTFPKDNKFKPLTSCEPKKEEATNEVLIQKIGGFRYVMTVKDGEVYFSRI